MNSNVMEILGQFPITVRGTRVLSWKGKKGTWSVQTDRGPKVLKKCPASRSRQMFLCRAVLHLKKNGAPVPGLVLTRGASPFAEHNGVCYTLSDSINGRSPEYGVPSELRKIMQTLGRFHLASRGFEQGGSQEGKRSHLGGWETGYRRHIEEMESFKESARSRPDEFAKLYLGHADSFISQGRQAMAMIRGDGYRQWVNKVQQQGNLCHQDFASANLLLNKHGLHVIDMDSLTFDLPARDLRKILNKVMKRKGWRFDQTAAMLRAYHSVHPLTADEYEVLKADVLFPHLFYGISSKYYKRGMEKDWSLGKPAHRLQAMIAAEQSKMAVLNRWNALIRQVMRQRGASP